MSPLGSMPLWRLLEVVVAIGAVFSIGAVGGASAGATRGAVSSQLWTTSANGYVRALAISGKTLYLGGVFSQLSPRTGPLVALTRSTAAQDMRFPVAAGGAIRQIAPDGDGGWYVAGDFDTIGGTDCGRLAHVRNDLSVDRSFCPRPDGEVNTVQLEGRRLYAGGFFTRIGGVYRAALAALDADSGTAENWDAGLWGQIYSGSEQNPPKPSVFAIAVSGSTLFFAGDFRRVGGEARDGVAAVATNTAAPLAWSPQVDWDHEGWGVVELAATATRVYGDCNCSIGGKDRYGPVALDARTGATLEWNPIRGSVNALTVSAGRLYVGGEFDTAAGQPRAGLAEFDAGTGELTYWNPKPEHAIVTAVAPTDSVVYVASKPADSEVVSSDLQSFDRSTGTAMTWTPPEANAGIETVATGGDLMAVGGDFSGIGGVERHNLAAIDVSTGKATAWNPPAKGHPGADDVNTLAVAGSTLYVGGLFTHVAGKPRSGLAAVDTQTGALEPWNPRLSGAFLLSVNAIAPAGRTIYVGGEFGRVGRAKRDGLAALDTATGRPTAWQPPWHSEVDALALGGSEVIVGGKDGLAVVGASSGRVEAKTSSPGSLVWAVAVAGNTVYAAGNFDRIGGKARVGLAAVSLRTGTVIPWAPHANLWVDALRLSGSTLYVAGDFSRIGGKARAGVAALDRRTGKATSWNPKVSPPAAILVVGRWVYLGGYGVAVVAR